MAGKTNQVATLFSQKKLLGKANTSAIKSDAQETIGSNIQVASQTIFGQGIPTSPAKTLYLLQSASAGADSTVEFVQFDLTAIAGTTYDANVGSFGSPGFGGGDEAQNSGPHSYKLSLTGTYQTLSSNAKKGNGTYDNSKTLYETLGGLQIVPPNFSNDSPNPYIMKLYSGDPTDEANEIPLLDEVDWSIDYYNGIVFLQDYSASKIPLYARAFLYVGKMLDEVVASGSSGSGDGGGGGSGSGSGTDDTREKKVYTVTGSHAAGSAFRVANTSFEKSGHRPNMIDVFLNGQLLHSGTSAEVDSDTADYTILSNNQIKLNAALETNDLVDAVTYLTSSSVTGFSSGLPSKIVYAVTGSHSQNIPLKVTNIDFSKASYKPDKIHIFLNGQLMTSGSSYDYELEGSSVSGVTFKFDLENNDVVTALLIG